MSIETEPEIIDKYNQLKACRGHLIKLRAEIPLNTLTESMLKVNEFNRIMKTYDNALLKFDNLVKTKLNRIQYERFRNVMVLLKDGL